jgi:hypothetical protein
MTFLEEVLFTVLFYSLSFPLECTFLTSLTSLFRRCCLGFMLCFFIASTHARLLLIICPRLLEETRDIWSIMQWTYTFFWITTVLAVVAL